MKTWNEKRGHRVTTANFKAAYPFQAEAGFGSRGAYIGQSRLGSAFVYDPWELYNQKRLTNPNIMLFGEIGSGKSALIKSFLHRQLIFRDRRAMIVDPKGEYGPLAAAWGAKPIRLAPGGKVRLNPLNPRAGASAQLALLLSVIAAAAGRDLESAEKSAAIEALKDARQQTDEPTIRMIVGLMLDPTPAMVREMHMGKKQLADAVRPAALALKTLCDGPLAGMFDGESTGEVDFGKKVIVLDLTAFAGSDAVGILMACASAWLTAEIMEQRKTHATMKNFWVVDEGWRILSHQGVGEWLQNSYKLSRANGISNVMVLHRLSDLTSAGDAGSRVERLAQGLLEDTGTHIIYKQARGALQQLHDTYMLSEMEAEIISNNTRGTGLWMLGGARFIVHHDLSPDEWDIIDTDQRMATKHAQVGAGP